jgi:hypothetical protein
VSQSGRTMQGSLSDTPPYDRPFGRRVGARAAKAAERSPLLRTERYQRYAPLALHAAFLMVVVVLWLLSDDPAFTLYVSGTAGMVVYGMLAVIELRRAPLFVSPLSTLFVWFFPPVGPSAIHYANKIADGEPMPFSVKMLQPDDVAIGYVMLILGNVALHAGLQWTRPFAANTALPGALGSPQRLALFILWALGIGTRIAAKFVAALGAISGVMHFASTAALAAYFLSHDPRKRGALFWSIFCIGTFFEFATNLNSGSKAYLMFSFMPALWLFVRDQKLRKFIPFLGAGMVALYVGVIAPVIMASRMTQLDDNVSRADRIVQVYSQGDYEKEAGIDKQLPKYLERAFDATAMACIYGEVQKTGLMYGEGMDYLVYAFIPRVIWPDKPTVTRGAWFTVYLGQARSEDKARTSLGQTAPGELYWNFGWAGVVVGMAMIGVMCGKLWKLATPFAERDALRLLLYFGVAFTVTHMAEAGSVIVALIYRTVTIGLAIIIFDHIRRIAELRRATIRDIK